MQSKEKKKPGRPKGSLNKTTLEKIANKEILDPRLYPPIHYKHSGRPKVTKKYLKDKEFREALLHPEENIKKRKISAKEELEQCRQYAVDWCYKHNAELCKYSAQFFVFRYKNDPTKRRYQIGYEYGDYPVVWLPFTSNLTIVEM